jgi:hypothetical protein
MVTDSAMKILSRCATATIPKIASGKSFAVHFAQLLKLDALGGALGIGTA